MAIKDYYSRQARARARMHAQHRNTQGMFVRLGAQRQLFELPSDWTPD